MRSGELPARRLTQFADFENMNAGGITYLDTYFVLWHEAECEALHFHEPWLVEQQKTCVMVA